MTFPLPTLVEWLPQTLTSKRVPFPKPKAFPSAMLSSAVEALTMPYISAIRGAEQAPHSLP